MDTWLIFHDFRMFLWSDGEYKHKLIIGFELLAVEMFFR